jgi:hypothetical protein
MTAWQCGGQGFESPQLHPVDQAVLPLGERPDSSMVPAWWPLEQIRCQSVPQRLAHPVRRIPAEGGHDVAVRERRTDSLAVRCLDGDGRQRPPLACRRRARSAADVGSAAADVAPDHGDRGASRFTRYRPEWPISLSRCCADPRYSRTASSCSDAVITPVHASRRHRAAGTGEPIAWLGVAGLRLDAVQLAGPALVVAIDTRAPQRGGESGGCGHRRVARTGGRCRVCVG